MNDLKENNKIIEDDPLKSYRGKWKNIFFTKYGSSALASEVFDTEAQAKNFAEETLAIWRREGAEYPNKVYSINSKDGRPSGVFAHQISHGFPLPIGEV